MNGDLRMRLKAYKDLNADERGFWQLLCNTLARQALCNESVLYRDSSVAYVFAPIENGEDDSAYMLGDDDGNYEVYIDDRMPFGMMIDFLLHELAHVQSWICNEDDDHGPEFGLSYADLYAHYLLLYEDYWSERGI